MSSLPMIIGGGGNPKELIQISSVEDTRTAISIDLNNYVKDATSLTIDDFLIVVTALNCKGSAYVATYSASYNSSTGILTFQPSGGLVDRIRAIAYVYAEPKV